MNGKKQVIRPSANLVAIMNYQEKRGGGGYLLVYKKVLQIQGLQKQSNV